ncbi:MAG TPA: Stp1/IreP family PP2C-type Ser/Thr phosphatase [Acidimicrobiales bacterium]|nr:Stp1/IreP family PP2C-type Ser/Thr phosphatase [Acidimicrobiales bacterium]
MTILRSGSASDVGRVRAVNEDLALESLTLFAVADGMGGHAGGEVASRTAIDALQQEFTRRPTVEGLIGAVRRANRSVWERSHRDIDLRGMGTTLTAAALVATDEGDRLVLANVGDSRTYRFHGGALTQLSKDHSVAEELFDRGELSAEEAAVHPHRHILTRALGVAPDVDVDVWQVEPEAGDRYLLCSDGLTNEVSTDRITGVLSSAADPQEAAQTLVRMANEHGGNDNVTVVVLDVVVGEDTTPGEAGAARGAVTALPSEGVGTVDEPPPPSLLSRFGSDAAGGVRSMTSRAASASARLGVNRRLTMGVLAFVMMLGALLAGGWGVVRWYVGSSYFVQLRHGQVTIYHGRLGGFLGMEPAVVDRTGIATAAVPPVELQRLDVGVQEPSLAAARQYVRNLRAEEAALQPAPTTTTTAPAAGG